MKKNSIIQRLWRPAIAAALGLVLLAGPGGADAHTIGFTARPILPDNQLTDATYYHLLTGPNHEQTIEVELTNHMDVPITLEAMIGNALTGSSGLISYTGTADEGTEQSLTAFAALALDELAQGDSAVCSIDGNLLTLAPSATVRVPIRIRTPDVPIDGQVLGGIVVTRVDDGSEAAETAFAIKSVFSYAIAVELQAERTVDIAPAFAIESLRTTRSAGWPALAATVDNLAPLVVTGAELRLRVYDQTGDAPRIDWTRDRLAMAPNSSLDCVCLFPEGERLPPGTYAARVDFSYLGETQTFETTLDIPDALAQWK